MKVLNDTFNSVPFVLENYTKQCDEYKKLHAVTKYILNEVLIINNVADITSYVNVFNQLPAPTTCVGAIFNGGKSKQKPKQKYNGKSYTIRTGKRGGKYILVNDKKIYL